MKIESWSNQTSPKSFFIHILFAWSVAPSHFSCFSIPVLRDYCNFGS